MIRRLGIIMSMSMLLLPACVSQSLAPTTPPTLISNDPAKIMANPARSRITLFWKPTSLTLKPGKRNDQFAKLWFSHNVGAFLENDCKSKGVEVKLESQGHKGRLYWNQYKLHATSQGPLSCFILGLDEYFDSISAGLRVHVLR
jgi:hypothetical protein